MHTRISHQLLAAAVLALLVGACGSPEASRDATATASETPQPAAASDQTAAASDQADASGAPGVEMIEISTPKGNFKVYTRKVGENPRIKVLLLHGGPGMTHELYEVFDQYFPQQGFEYYYYDQLGSHFSDQPDDDDLWVTERFVDEVEQVRQALGLDHDNFYLFGQSWGGILAMEYALAYQDHLKGLIISNMMASIPAYNKYADQVLAEQLEPAVLAEIRQLEAAKDFANPRYTELVQEHFYTQHILRRPLAEWPPAVTSSLQSTNPKVYVLMQGPSEFGASGRLEHWDRTADIHNITVPTLVIGAGNDTMDPEHMRFMSEEIPNARFLLCPNGSHLSQWDDSEAFFGGLIGFIKDVDAGTF